MKPNKNLMFKHPTTCLISGVTMSGKTFLTMRIINDWKYLFDLNKKKFRVLWFYTQTQNIYTPVDNEYLFLHFHKGIPNNNLIDQYKPDLIVLDDLMESMKNNPILSEFFTQTCHHKNISVFFLVQNLFVKGEFMRTVSLNSHYFIIMLSPRAVKQVEYFSRQIKKKNSNEDSEKMYENATKNRDYSYLLIDLHPTSSYDFRYRSRITRLELPVKPYKKIGVENATKNRDYSYLLIDLHPTSSYDFRYRSRITRLELPGPYKKIGVEFPITLIHQSK